ncbi:macro domain-containing protein [Streptomyces sp. NPDC050504]|uniref:macro domain-containing protein n=1 Tax=Streptomyces sp. NPDC050504 TaxID=3365618 RepID=UPI0037B78A91
MSGLPGRALLANLRRPSTIALFTRSFLAALGLVAGVVGLATGLFPDLTQEFGVPILTGALAVPLGYALWTAWPRSSYSREFGVPTTRISVVVGDLFEQDGHLVIGMTDTFDTEPPRIIATTSVQAQFLAREYGDDRTALDADLVGALRTKPVVGRETRETKPLGKLDRYPLGTVAVLRNERRTYYGLAYSRMTEDCVAESSVSRIWDALAALWPTVRTSGDLGTLNIPAIGLGLARLSGQISQADLVHLIVISFLTASRERVVTEHLRIVLTPESAVHTDLRRLSAYLEAQ